MTELLRLPPRSTSLAGEVRVRRVLPNDCGAELHGGAQGVRVMVVGGAPMDRPVRMWWNFVATDRDRIAAAARRWSDDGFAQIPGETQRVAAPPWRG